MAGLEGKVAFITGAARGQGRAEAVRLAAEGADILGIDICEDIASMDYANATLAELEETKSLVEAEGRKCFVSKADTRDLAGLQKAFDEGLAFLGRVDIVVANAGIVRLSDADPADDVAVWRDIVDVNLTGTWNTVNVALPTLRSQGTGGVIIITSSSAGLRATPMLRTGAVAYTATKTALVGLMKQLASVLAPESIRVNTVHPTGVATGMTMNETMGKLFEAAARGEEPGMATMQNALPIEILQPEDIANAVAFLVSDQAAYITGTALPVDAGFCIR